MRVVHIETAIMTGGCIIKLHSYIRQIVRGGVTGYSDR